MSVFFIVLITVLNNCSNGWDLRSHAIGQNYFASSLAVFRNRAFLALPRSSCYNNLTNPTLIEVPWTGEQKNVIVRRKIEFPNEDGQDWGQCKDIQDAISVDVETKWSRLWILDKGTRKCPAKILIFNLILNTEIDRFPLLEIERINLNSLVVDSDNFRAFIGEIGEGGLLVFSLSEGKWSKINVIMKTDSIRPVSSYFLALSKVQNVLYLSGKYTTELFLLNLKKLPIFQKEKTFINATFLGHKLGASSGFVTDLKGGLTYFLIRDYAVVRWDTNKPLIAEHHEVLAQSYKSMPFVSNFFIGPQNGVWALINPMRPSECVIVRKKIRLDKDTPLLKTRTIRLLNYVRKSKKIAAIKL